MTSNNRVTVPRCVAPPRASRCPRTCRDVPDGDALHLFLLGTPVVKLFAMIGSTIGSYAGWYAGESVGMFTAFIASAIGGGIGLYYGRRLGQHYGG